MQLVTAQKKFRAQPTCGADQIGVTVAQFSVAISLMHMQRTMLTHGLHSCRQLMDEFEEKAMT